MIARARLVRAATRIIVRIVMGIVVITVTLPIFKADAPVVKVKPHRVICLRLQSANQPVSMVLQGLGMPQQPKSGINNIKR